MVGSKWDIVEQSFPPDKIPQLKELFARLMAKYNDDTTSVLNDLEFSRAFENNIPCKLYAINNWTFDIEIKEKIESYRESELEKGLPSKYQVAQMFLDIAGKSTAPRDKIAALLEYSKIMGFDSKETVGAGSTQNVILVTDNGTEMSWEEKLKQNQYELQRKADELLSEDDEVIKH